MRRLLAFPIGLILALSPAPAAASSSWGSPGYGDPPGWCTNFSDMWVATVVTNDPHVGTNPERNTFYGFHPNPGYDDWYGYFYGDFRGSPGDGSGWIKLLHEKYPDHYHWNFATNGWAIHGHAKTSPSTSGGARTAVPHEEPPGPLGGLRRADREAWNRVSPAGDRPLR
jgi:hypothetical protein